jgi:hypothetical protein
MARQKNNYSDKLTVLRRVYEDGIREYKQRQVIETNKTEPDQTKLGIWQAKIDYYEKNLEEAPKRIEDSEKLTQKEIDNIEYKISSNEL